MNKTLRFLLFCFIVFNTRYISAQDLKIGLPLGHTSRVWSAKFSPDGKTLITASHDKTAKLWEVNSGKLLIDFKGHKDVVHYAEFSPDGKKVLTISSDEIVNLWDTNSGKLLFSSDHYKIKVNSVKFSTDGRKLLTVSDNESANVWDVNSGKLLFSSNISDKRINFVGFSPNGRKLFIVNHYYSPELRDTNTGKLLFTLNDQKSRVKSFQFTRNGGKLLIVFENHTAKFWDVNSGKLINTFLDNLTGIIDVQLSPNEQTLITTSNNYEAKLWDINSGKLLLSLGINHGLWNTSSLQFSPNGKNIIMVSNNKSLKLWNVNSRKLLHTLKGHDDIINSIRFSPDGKTIVTASDDQTVKLWKIDSGELLHTYQGFYSISGAYYAEFSPDGTTIVAIDTKAKLLDTNNGELLYSFEGNTNNINSAQFSSSGESIVITSDNNAPKLIETETGKLLQTLNGHKRDVNSARFSPDGKTIVTASDDKTAKIWEIDSGELLYSLNGHTYPLTEVNSAEFSPNGKTIVTASSDGTAKLWNRDTGKLILTFSSYEKPILNTLFSAQFSSDGKTIVTASINNKAKLWSVQTGSLLKTLHSKDNGVWGINSAQFSSDDKTIVTASSDGTAKLWNVDSGKLLRSFKGHQDDLTSAEFSPDGKTLLTASDDNTAKLWDVDTGFILKTFVGHLAGVTSAKFDSTGKRVITSSDDGSVILWDTSTGEEIIRYFNFASDTNKWVHLHPSGLFDASPEAMELMYWTYGEEVIQFSQLKGEYYEPGLWEKAIKGKYIGNTDITKDNFLLYPDTELGKIKNNILPITLTKRDGGYGEVSIFLNGKEIIKDARPKDFNHKLSKQTLNVDISEYQKFMQAGNNTFMVKVTNQTGGMVSRGAKVITNKKKESRPPNFYAVIIGVSDYVGDAIDLKYPDKDADAMEKALQMGTKNLFNESYIMKMATNHSLKPRKEKIKAVFEDIAQKAKPEDVLLVYMSGHGINWTDNNNKTDFYFLTEDARFADKEIYNNKKIRETTSISTDEWVEYIKKITANKTVMIIDACGSGKAVDNLIAQRDIDSEKIKAIDRMQDRTGMFVISGSAADKVSYEASVYGQGLLTYTLLKGMSGVALKEYTKIDVSTLFNYAKDQVNILAKDVGAIQEPQVLMAKSGSFDIGILQLTDQKKIVVNEPKRVYLRSTFLNTKELEDNLGLSTYLDRKLNSLLIEEKNLIWVDASQYVNGCKISGSYLQKNGKIELIYKVKCRDHEKKYTIMASTKESLVQKVIENL
ncbi:beta-propeller domain-containing protein [Kordia sp.]|uniref:WD40 domain-containing protein n=1 Tax=Kordia sp. TaxID=1965332 RepID=UPI003D2BA584